MARTTHVEFKQPLAASDVPGVCAGHRTNHIEPAAVQAEVGTIIKSPLRRELFVEHAAVSGVHQAKRVTLAHDARRLTVWRRIDDPSRELMGWQAAQFTAAMPVVFRNRRADDL